MEPKPEKQKLAKDLYLHTDKSQSEIAEILDVNRKTIFLWIRKGRWEEMKLAAQQGPGMILQNLYNHVHKINKKIRDREDQCPLPQEVEMLRKLLGMTKNLAKKNIGFYMEAFEELTNFIFREDKDFCQKLAPHIDRFVEGTFGDENFDVDKRVSQNLAEIRNNLAKKDATENEEPEEIPEQKIIFNGWPCINPENNPTNQNTQPDHTLPSGEVSQLGRGATIIELPKPNSDNPATQPDHTLSFGVPAKEGAELGREVCGTNGATNLPTQNPPEPNTSNTPTGITPPDEYPISPKEKIEKNGATPPLENKNDQP